jgi:DNA-binding protein HU-beta
MNTADFAEKLAADHDLPRSKAKHLLEAAFAAVGEAIARGEEVSIPGSASSR